ncbi:protein translocase subunit SecF [Sandaracinus amylolyticus]|uniref:protein translocase subunit SecF n=1 Tax=Sandaracinus amylolyticus TaxID=927083 RepID=UPI001F02A0A8|nr:protein translocase subunit SecF [Sandaracinus amylolyticus]UJR79781.1 Protein-export membrane protein SecF [Sandaracinus amylolyticus]
MEFIKPGRVFDFMRYRTAAVATSSILVLLSVLSLFWPGPNFGIDFTGGTEVQLRFRGDISTAELRETLEGLEYQSPDVIAVQGAANEYIVRVREVSTLPADIDERIRTELGNTLGDTEVIALRVSPGGDKVSVRLGASAEPAQIRTALEASGVSLRGDVVRFGPESDFRYEANLVGVADRLVSQLEEQLGERGPEEPLRIEWVGPRAGEQLRNSALKALLYAIAFIMVYVAFRFDLRFAPGGIIALIHDAVITVGVFVLVQREFNLTTIASLLTIIGYSINDTIVIYDRIRENTARHRGKSMAELINISTSEMLSRTIVTSGVTLLAIVPFFIWGTQVIQDIAFALFIGFLAGVYSTIYIAAPVTEWFDKVVFAKARERALAAARGRAAAGT